MAALIVLSQHLEGARFQAFWQAADACKDVVGSVPGYYDAIRAYILTVVTSTCQKASRAMVAESLRLDSSQLEALVRRPLSQLCGGDGGAGELFCSALSRALCCPVQIESHRKSGWSESQAQGSRAIIAFPRM